MRNIAVLFASAAVIGAGLFWCVTAPDTLPEDYFAGLEGDVTRGEAVFTATGCASCHTEPGAQGDAHLILSGGQEFPSDFGTFLAPNISSDPLHGIGNWSLQDLGNAIMRGVSPEGEHYYPALPYWSYAKLEKQDVVDLYSYMKMQPASDTPSKDHHVGFPFNQRRLLGGWKFLNGPSGFVVQGDLTAQEERGRYIAEAMAHCAECHTPRNLLGGLKTGQWFAGVTIEGEIWNPSNITPGALEWMREDIIDYMSYDTSVNDDGTGSHMVHVVSNMSKLPMEEREALAAYLKKVPAIAAAE